MIVNSHSPAFSQVNPSQRVFDATQTPQCRARTTDRFAGTDANERRGRPRMSFGGGRLRMSFADRSCAGKACCPGYLFRYILAIRPPISAGSMLPQLASTITVSLRLG
jgi:hypothetical protein